MRGPQTNILGRQDYIDTKTQNANLPAETVWHSNTTDFRPITLLNSDYKILTRLIARSQRPVLEEHLTNDNFAGSLGIRSTMQWRQCAIPSHTLKAGRSCYVCFLWISKASLIGYCTTTCFKSYTSTGSAPLSSMAFSECTREPHHPLKLMATNIRTKTNRFEDKKPGTSHICDSLC